MIPPLPMLLAAAAAADLPPARELAPVRTQLESLLNKIAADGLPSDLLVSKVREGLAKGVDANRIAAAAQSLADNLREAQRFAAQNRTETPSSDLVRALAQAKSAGVALEASKPLLRARVGGPVAAHAVDVLADLSRRGFPAGRAVGVVGRVVERDPGSIDRVPVALETLRKEQALSTAEAVDALLEGMASSDSLQAAVVRANAAQREKNASGKPGRARTGEPALSDGPGKSEFAPGQLKKAAGDVPGKRNK